MSGVNIQDVLELLTRLKAAHIHYRLDDPTEDALMVDVAVPGERWEIEFLKDGEIQIEVFTSNGSIRGPELSEDLFRRFSD